MKKLYLYITFQTLLVLIGNTLMASVRNDEKPFKQSANITPKSLLTKADIEGLNEAISKLNTPDLVQAQIIDKMNDIDLEISSVTEDHRSQARKMMAFLDNNPERITTTLNFESLMTLPVGLKKTLSDNSEVTIGIYSVKFDNSQGALATLFCRMTTQVETPTGGREKRDILFGVNNVRFTKKGGLISSNVEAVLLGDFTIPSKNWTVQLKGAPTIIDPSSSQTYISFDCNGFKQVNVSADIIFPRHVILPYDVANRTSTSGRFSLSASALLSSGFRDLLLNVNGTDKAFAVAGLDQFGFKVNNLIVDMSDIANSANMSNFPSGYRHPDAGSTLWRGVYLGELDIYFPKAFEKESGTDIKATGLIIDNTGFTGKTSFSDSTGIVFQAQKWQYSVKNFNLDFLQNKLISGGFGGGFYTPINGRSSDVGNAGFAYTAMIYEGGKYQFSISSDAENVPIKPWKAKGKIYKGSTIEMLVHDNKFYPSCSLSGELSISANKINKDEAIEGFDEDSEATARFTGIIFENLSIKTSPVKNIDLSVGGFKYINSDVAKIAKIPVAITRFEKDINSPVGEIWLSMGLKISLLKDFMSGSTDFTLRSKYNMATGKLELGTSSGKKKISLDSLYIEGSGTAFAAVGKLIIFEETKSNIAKGFDGKLMVALYKPFQVGVEVQALFGRSEASANEEFRCGFFSAYAGVPKELISPPGVKPIFEAPTPSGNSFKIPTGLGDLAINGLGLAIYFNMKPEYNSEEPGQVKFSANKDIPFGLKAMLGIQNGAFSPTPPSFVGQVALDFFLSSTHGINSIGVFGKGTLGVQRPVYSLDVSSLIKDKSNTELSNRLVGNHTSEGLLSSSSKIPDIKDKDINNDPSEIRVALGFLLDVPNKIAHLDAVVDINVGDLKGIGVNGRAGKMVMHFEPSNNYFYLGRSPHNQRVGLRYGNGFEIGAYLMAGKGLDPFPLPPPEVLQFFPTLRNRINTINLSGYANPDTISGFAVGANVKTAIDLKTWLARIEGSAIAGFDLLIAQGTPCAINNWLGQMQLYGIANVKVKAGLVRFNTGIGMNLYGQGLKPFGASGDVCVKYGRKNKTLCLSFKVGTKC